MPRSPATSQASADDLRPYQSLYRRFRPQTFAEVLGQDHVTRALRNSIRDGHTTHAYLFSGARGTGKTSTARILAKALNCESPKEGEPCGVCESCLSITAGTSYDVHELDAASNNGVDAMRDLVARASLATPGRWKVYIVDEVHMLSTAASNALLKTLEEPPEHVVFVLATTDPQKVLPTLRSRTQHFEFHLIGEEELAALVSRIAKEATIAADDETVTSVVRRARGSARDALSALDQIAAGGSAVDDSEALAAVIAGIAAGEVKEALIAIDDAVRKGRDPAQLAVDLVERLRGDFLTLVGAAPANAAWSADSPEILAVLGAARCVRAMDLVGSAIVAMREAPEPRITLEVALIRAARPDTDTLPESIVDRLERLERRLETIGAGGSASEAPRPAERALREPPPIPRPSQGVPPSAESPIATPDPTPAPTPQSEPLPERQTVAPEAAREGNPTVAGDLPSRDDLVAAWGDEILPKLRPKLRAIYQAGHFVDTDGTDAVLALPNKAHIDHAEPLRKEVAEALGRHFGRPIGVRLIAEAGQAPRQSSGSAKDESEAGDTDEAELVAETRALANGSGQKAPVSGLEMIEDRLREAFPGAEEV